MFSFYIVTDWSVPSWVLYHLCWFWHLDITKTWAFELTLVGLYSKSFWLYHMCSADGDLVLARGQILYTSSAD